MMEPKLSGLRRMAGKIVESLSLNGVRMISTLCAFLMLCVVPIVFHNAFFDINRVKVYTVYAGIGGLSVLMLIALFIRKKQCGQFVPNRHIVACYVSMGVFMMSCLCSFFFSGMKEAVLLGNQGRYCGLIFFVCCAAAFYMIAFGQLSCTKLHPSIVLCASAIALLGVLNALGIDPLGFYDRIRKGQERLFMSTIGHFDFFGTYMVLLLSLSGGLFVFSRRKFRRVIGLMGIVMMALGAAASRTDSALIGMHLACAALLALSGGNDGQISRALTVWSVCFAALPVMDVLFRFGRFGNAFSGLHALLCDSYIAGIASLLLLGAAALFRWMKKAGKSPISRKTTTTVVMAVLLAVVLALVVLILYFTIINPQFDLGTAEKFLRFSDAWGSYRGFVYTRSLHAYAGFSPVEKLFGKGLDTTKLILEPYFDHPVVEIVGIFDDAHNQLLQLLLTGGLFGMISFALFYAVILFTLYRHAERDPLICGVCACVFSYSVVMLLNVTQPILIATYFSLSGLGLSKISFNAKRRPING